MLRASLRQFPVKQLELDFDSEFISTMKRLEEKFWEHVDARPFLKTKFQHGICFGGSLTNSFLKKLLTDAGYQSHVPYVNEYVKRYNKYNKSRQTAGVIFKSGESFIVVKTNNGGNKWSMPKGKQEDDENLVQTACREFCEETGIDVQEFINDHTENVKILKTLFYVLESEYKVNVENYYSREISAVKWVSKNDVLLNKDKYSKQVQKVCETFF